MRCTHCDLPLSPTNPTRVCPRCHMPTATGTNTAKSKQTPVVQPPSWGGDGTTSLRWQGNSGPFVGVPPNSGPWDTNLSGTSQPTPYPQPGQMWNLTPPPSPIPAPAVSSPQFSQTDRNWGSRPLLQTRGVHSHNTRTTTSNLGFIIAGVCVVTGGLLLILVYFMAAGLSPTTVQTQSISTGNSGAMATRHSTPTAVVPTPTKKSSPAATGAFPAQQYITNPQMASEVNTSTAQVGQTATTFKVGQRVYVTFTLHPAGRDGAVCLLWYTNAKMFSHFEFAVTPNSTVAYSYTYFAASGPAYVEIYWASNVTCSDKMLAQRVNFTVIN